MPWGEETVTPTGMFVSALVQDVFPSPTNLCSTLPILVTFSFSFLPSSLFHSYILQASHAVSTMFPSVRDDVETVFGVFGYDRVICNVAFSLNGTEREEERNWVARSGMRLTLDLGIRWNWYRG